MTNYHNNLAKKNSYFTFKICFTVTFSFKNITVIPFSQLQCNLEKFYLQIFFKFNWLIRIVDYISPLHFTELAGCLKWQFLCITKNNLPAASHSVLCISIVFFRVITSFKKNQLVSTTCLWQRLVVKSVYWSRDRSTKVATQTLAWEGVTTSPFPSMHINEHIPDSRICFWVLIPALEIPTLVHSSRYREWKIGESKKPQKQIIS